ncbi:MAG: flagellin [Myxococcales bacterium]|nr:MAG: flagellin [Myxococcales bacterium]
MGFRIQNNIASMNSRRHLERSSINLNKSLERLSSGYRVNSAADDAAGLAASMRFRAEVAALRVAGRNAAEATSMLQVAEGAMGEIELILVRMKELATQASSGNVGSDLSKIDAEATQLEAELSRIVGFTEYDSHTLLDGTFGTTNLSSTPPVDFTAANGIQHIDLSTAQGNTTYYVSAISYSANVMTLSDGTVSQQVDYSAAVGLAPNETSVLDFSELGVRLTLNSAFDETAFTAGLPAVASRFYTSATGLATFQLGDRNNGYNRLGFTLPNLSLATLAGGSTADIDLSTNASAQLALDAVESAISSLALARADVGAILNRITYTTSNLAVSIENKVASESIIRDVDMASEMTEFTKNNILIQTGVAMLGQSNQIQQTVLQLLR